MVSTRRSQSAPAPYAQRLAGIRHRLREEEHDGLLITNPRDIRYLSPFSGEDSYALVTARRFCIVSDGRFTEELEPLKSWVEIIIRRGVMAERIGELIGDLRLKRVGVQAEHLTVAARKGLVKHVGRGGLHDTAGFVSKLRLIKDEHEVALIRKGVKCQQESLRATLADLKPGQTEAEVAARLEYEMKVRGADEPAFETNVSARANGSMPHHRAGRTKIANSQPLLIDWGARVGGYCSDMTRTWSIGRMKPKIREIYEIVLEAQLAGIAAIRPGANCHEVDAVARRIIVDAGFGEFYSHGLGHGIGLDVHEEPSLSFREASKKQTLTPGMVVTVEPGIYLPGIGGVRIEDDVLVTEKRHKVLSNWPKDLESAIL